MTTILFVGDSITVGLVGYASKQTDGSSFRRGASASLGWTGVGPFADPNGLLHGGVGGSTTYTFLRGNAQFVVDEVGGTSEDSSQSWVQKFKPDLVHVMLGVNDILSFNEPIPDLFDRLHSLCADAIWQMKGYQSRPTVYLSTVVESLLGDEIIRAHALNGKIKSFAENGADYSILGVDSAGPFNGALMAQNWSSKGYTVDGTHPNQRGYDLIAQGLMTSIASKSTQGPSTFAKIAGVGLVGAGLYMARKFL
jgi:lysophospholipase L1-like esterase